MPQRACQHTCSSAHARRLPTGRPRQSPHPTRHATLTHRPADAEVLLDFSAHSGRPAKPQGSEQRKQRAAGARHALPVRPAAPVQSSRYVRERDLPQLIAMWPAELARCDRHGQTAVVRSLHNALRAERRRALAGHWTYDLARHSQLLAAYRAEVSTLARVNAATHDADPDADDALPTPESTGL